MSLLFYCQIVIISWFIIISEQKCVLMAINVISCKFILNRNLGMLTFDNWSCIHFFCLGCCAVRVEYWRLELNFKVMFTLNKRKFFYIELELGRTLFMMHHNYYQNNRISWIHKEIFQQKTWDKIQSLLYQICGALLRSKLDGALIKASFCQHDNNLFKNVKLFFGTMRWV